MKKLLTIMVLALALCLLCSAALAASDEFAGVFESLADYTGKIAGWPVDDGHGKVWNVDEYPNEAAVKAILNNVDCGGYGKVRVYGPEDIITHVIPTAYVYVKKGHVTPSVLDTECAAVTNPKTVLPTCSEDGHLYYVCPNCGEPDHDVVAAATGHIPEMKTVEATCLKEGYQQLRCSVCDLELGDPIVLPIEGHTAAEMEGNGAKWVDKIERVKTCVDDGVVYWVCSVCHRNYDVEILGLAEPKNHADLWDDARWADNYEGWTLHVFDTPVVIDPATCEKGTKYYHKCSRCTYEEYFFEGDPIAHTFYVKNTTPANTWDCTITDMTLACRTCATEWTIVGGDITKAYDENTFKWTVTLDKTIGTWSDELPHTEWVENNPGAPNKPNCTEKSDGVTYSCSGCGKVTPAFTLPALGHDWDKWEKILDPDEEKGIFGHWQRKCLRPGCDSKQDWVQYEAPIDNCPHENWVIIAPDPDTIECEKEYTNVVFQCPVCKMEKIESKYTREHEFEHYADKKVPTCSEPGIEILQCKFCGELKTEGVLATGKHVPEETIEEGTCLVPGFKETKCKYCGIPMGLEDLGLAPHKDVVTEYPSNNCLVAGIKITKCEVCGRIETEDIPALGAHTMVEVDRVPSTCIAEGKVIYECENCPNVEIETLPLGDHTIVILEGKDATCTETGLTEGSYCSVCGEPLVLQEVIDMIPHTPVLIDSLDPTCVDEGYEQYACDVCGAELDYIVLDPTGDHDYQWVEEESWPATCAWGRDLYRCTVCGDEWEDWLEPVKEHENTYEVVLAEPNCIEWGQIAVKCYDCGDSWIVWVEPNGEHVVEIIPGYPATCAETGLSDGEFCSVCGEILVEQVELEKVAHDWVIDEDLGTAPTCTAGGVIVKTCSFCGISTKENVDKLGHDYDDGVVTTEPTYDEEGVKTFTCSRCGDTYTEPVEKLTPPAAFEIDEEKTKFNAEDNVLVGNATQVPGTEEAGEKYARVTFFMADGTYVVTLCAINDAGDFQAMTTGDVVYIAIQIIDNFSVRPAEYNAMGWIEFDPTQD